MTSLTFGMIKPDAVDGRNIGRIISLIEQIGMQIVGLRTKILTDFEAQLLYRAHAEKDFFDELIDFTTSGPVVLMAIAAPPVGEAVSAYRVLVVDVLRPEFGFDFRRNAVHASDSPEAAQRELAIFFPELL